MLTQRIFSNSKSNKDFSNNSEDEQIQKILKEIKDDHKRDSFFERKSPRKIRTFYRNRSILSSTTSVGTSYKKSFTNKKNENSLSYKLKDKITKESLILELRQELKYHMKFNLIYKNLLKNVIHLKEIVKENRDKVKHNTDVFIETFRDRYDMIQQYEKTIISLKEEKEEIIQTNTDLLQLKENTNKKLLKEFSDIQEKNSQQKEKIDSLIFNIKDLEFKKSNINEELQEKIKVEQKNYEKQLNLYKSLFKRYDYFMEEYNSFIKTGEEITKIDVKLNDDTNAKNSLIKEDLEVTLKDKMLQKSYLISNINKLKLQIKLLEQKQKEEKFRQERKLLACKIMGFTRNRVNKNKYIKNKFNVKEVKKSLSYNDIIFSK